MSGSEPRLTHLDAGGRARMVDVGDRPETDRQAVAEAELKINEAGFRAITQGSGPKGEVLEVARLAGIMGAKRTPELIPLCHPINLTHVDLEVWAEAPDRIRIRATARCRGSTGVEMEALTAAAVAGLTVIDMVKSLDPWITLGGVQLISKSGGRSGAVQRQPGRGGVGAEPGV